MFSSRPRPGVVLDQAREPGLGPARVHDCDVLLRELRGALGGEDHVAAVGEHDHLRGGDLVDAREDLEGARVQGGPALDHVCAELLVEAAHPGARGDRDDSARHLLHGSGVAIRRAARRAAPPARACRRRPAARPSRAGRTPRPRARARRCGRARARSSDRRRPARSRRAPRACETYVRPAGSSVPSTTKFVQIAKAARLVMVLVRLRDCVVRDLRAGRPPLPAGPRSRRRSAGSCRSRRHPRHRARVSTGSSSGPRSTDSCAACKARSSTAGQQRVLLLVGRVGREAGLRHVRKLGRDAVRHLAHDGDHRALRRVAHRRIRGVGRARQRSRDQHRIDELARAGSTAPRRRRARPARGSRRCCPARPAGRRGPRPSRSRRGRCCRRAGR